MNKIFGLLLLVVCLAVSSVQGQGSCPITASDVSSLDFSQVKSDCDKLSNPPSVDACDACGASLFLAFAPTYPKIGLTSQNFPRDANAAQAALTQAVTPCANILLPALSRAGVNVGQLVTLRNCPSNQPGPKLTQAVEQVFPNLPPASTSG